MTKKGKRVSFLTKRLEKQNIIRHTEYSWLEISVKAIINNLRVIKRLSGDKRVLVPVKCNAYGHGLIEISKVLEKNNIDYLGVAFIKEGLELRNAGISAPILVFNRVFENDYKIASKFDLSLTLLDELDLKILKKVPAKIRNKLKFHINIDTGMNRLGINYNNALEFVKKLKSISINIEGIYTHLSSADSKNKSDINYTNLQITNFKNISDMIMDIIPDIKYLHAANSSSILNYPESVFNLIRPGILLYGYYADNNIIGKYKIKPAMTLKARITFIKEVEKGECISYNRLFITKKKMKVATVGIGYGDGYNRRLSNKGYVIVKNNFAKIVGRVCMDQIIIDITGLKSVKVGDEVVVFGTHGKKSIPIENIAKELETIPYEIVTSINERVKRVYV